MRARPDCCEQIAATLRAAQPIASWPPDVVAALARQSQLRQYDKGEIIEERNDPVTGLWVVASGSARSFRSTENGLYFLNSMLWPGDIFGVAAILDGWPTYLSYSTRCESWIVFIPKAAMEDAMRDVNRMRDMAICMALRSRVVHESVFSTHVESLAVRLAKLLAFLPRRSQAFEAALATPVWPDPSPIDFTQEELAEMLSVSRQFLNRTLVPFLRNGILRPQRRRHPRGELQAAARDHGAERAARRILAQRNPVLGRAHPRERSGAAPAVATIAHGLGGHEKKKAPADFSAGAFLQPLTHTTWRSVCTISTRSLCAAITASMSL